MKADEYDQWYQTPRGQWIGQRESRLLLGALSPRRGESVLDIGCGSGYFTRALTRQAGITVTGIDRDPERIAYARGRDISAARYQVADACQLPFADNSFDLAVAITSLCFVDDERAALLEMLRVARSRIAIGLLNRHSLLWRQKGRGGSQGAYRGAHWHTPSEARALLQGLAVNNLKLQTAIHVPTGSCWARAVERLWPPGLHSGAFIPLTANLKT